MKTEKLQTGSPTTALPWIVSEKGVHELTVMKEKERNLSNLFVPDF